MMDPYPFAGRCLLKSPRRGMKLTRRPSSIYIERELNLGLVFNRIHFDLL